MRAAHSPSARILADTRHEGDDLSGEMVIGAPLSAVTRFGPRGLRFPEGEDRFKRSPGKVEIPRALEESPNLAKDLATPSSRIGNKPVRSGFRSMTRACQREDWTKGRERRSAKKIRELLNIIYYYKSFWFRFFFSLSRVSCSPPPHSFI